MERRHHFWWFAGGRRWCEERKIVKWRMRRELTRGTGHGGEKPDRPDELDRIENSGGKVINWNGQRVLGVLATSRSIGDMYLKPYVIPDPEVVVSKRSDEDEFLILASDGLWDVIPNDVACDVTRRCLNGQTIRRCDQQSKSHKKDDQSSEGVKESLAARAASFLAELAIARGSRDNISVIVVDLN